MELYKCGTIVTLKLLNQDAMIVGICMRFDKITYELSWANGGQYNVAWFHEEEFHHKGLKEKKVGFK